MVPATVASVLTSLLAVPIDELPAEMHTTRTCDEALQAPPPSDAASDYDVTELSLAEMVDEAPLIVRATVAEVGAPVEFVPDGVPAEFLAATGARSAEDLLYAATPIEVTVSEVVQGEMADEDSALAFFDGCWAESATGLTIVGEDVLIFGYPAPNAGVNQLAGADVRVYDWFSVSADGVLHQGDNSLQVVSRFRALDGRRIDDVIEEITELSANR